jgi:lipopolysaccharide cholinephosphotransferase
MRKDKIVIKKAYTLSPSELRQLQLILRDMLIELDRICKKHKIRYCIIAGTLLGAVRNGGFIPWDDDVDVAMTRGEYERFRDICECNLDASRFFFQDNTTDPHYPWGWGRLRRVDSEFVRVGQEHLQMRTGIFLDVFPIDSVPDFAPILGIFTAYCFILRKILYAETGAVSVKSGQFWYGLLKKIPKQWVFKRLSYLHNWGRNHETKYVRILMFPTPKGRPFGYLHKWYVDTDEIEFERQMFPCVKDYDEYLTYKFGNYMTLPPEHERRWHTVSSFRLPKK